jgi:serine/threonine protein phosphatase PrpC
MTEKLAVSNLKLCLEVLSREQIAPELTQLQLFLNDETQVEFINAWAKELKHRWASFFSPENPPDLESATEMESAMMLRPPQDYSAHLFVRFRLPNATVERTYQAQLEWSSDTVITIENITGLEDLGLTYQREQNQVMGEPHRAGEYPLTIIYQQVADPSHATHTAQLNLVINSDPKSLWKNIPSDRSALFWKADSDFQGSAGHYGWKLALASKRGRSHAHIGSCRDDDFAVAVDNDTLWHIVAVADGAGSSQYSRQGARLLVQTCVNSLQEQLQQVNQQVTALIQHWQQTQQSDDEAAIKNLLAGVFTAALTNCIAALNAAAEQQESSLRDFYSTLLIAIHKSLPAGEFIAAYWIGDGGLGLYQAAQHIDLLGTSDSGEYAGQTRFLDVNALEPKELLPRLQCRSVKNFTALVLMTDGISDPLFETDNDLRQLGCWDSFWQQIEPLLSENPELSAQQLTEWLDFWSPGNHDDRTLALIYR